MRKRWKRVLAVSLGFAVGLAIGPISVFGIFARHVLLGREDWPKLTEGLLYITLACSLPAAVNGAIGAGVTARSGRLNRRAVTILPVAMHVVVFVATLILGSRRSPVFGIQLYLLLFGVVVWAAGRLGQRIGAVFYRGDENKVDVEIQS